MHAVRARTPVPKTAWRSFVLHCGFLGLPEFVHFAWVERILRVSVPIALADDFLVNQQVVALAEDLRQKPAVLIPARRAGLDLQPDPLALDQTGRESAGFLLIIASVVGCW